MSDWNKDPAWITCAQVQPNGEKGCGWKDPNTSRGKMRDIHVCPKCGGGVERGVRRAK